MRFYEPGIDNACVGMVMALSGKNSHHFSAVLRGRLGEKLEIFSGQGGYFSAVVEKIERKKVWVKIYEYHDESSDIIIPKVLAISMTGNQKMAMIIQKATELGVTEIQPIEAKRSQGGRRGDFGAQARSRYEKIIIASAMQSGLNVLPKLRDPQRLEDLHWEDWREAGIGCYLCDPRGESAVRGSVRGSVWFIGPEGGWTEEEESHLESQGCMRVRLAKTVLRMETAAICAMFLGGS